MKIFILGCIILVFCSACASGQTLSPIKTGTTLVDTAESADQTYSRGRNAISLGQHASAIDHFTMLIDHYPTDKRIPQALLNIAYAHYQLGDLESSAKITRIFIASKKNHELLDYAFYLHGLARYSAGIKKLQSNEVVGNNRDNLAREAFESFLHVVRYYPNSQYHEDSRVRMEALFNILANNELVLAKRALEQDNSHEAIARSKYITQHYARTDAALEAYNIMIDAFEAQGKQTQADAMRESLLQREIDHQHLKNKQDS